MTIGPVQIQIQSKISLLVLCDLSQRTMAPTKLKAARALPSAEDLNLSLQSFAALRRNESARPSMPTAERKAPWNPIRRCDQCVTGKPTQLLPDVSSVRCRRCAISQLPVDSRCHFQRDALVLTTLHRIRFLTPKATLPRGLTPDMATGMTLRHRRCRPSPQARCILPFPPLYRLRTFRARLHLN